MLPTIRLRAKVPAKIGFLWVYLNDDGELEPGDPPADWPEMDHIRPEDLIRGDVPDPLLSDRFFLARYAGEYAYQLLMRQRWGRGKMIDARELYLNFASQRLTPPTIMALANRYGFLREFESDSLIKLHEHKGKIGLRSYFGLSDEGRYFDLQKPYGKRENISDDEMPQYLEVESARDWLLFNSSINIAIQEWKQLSDHYDPSSIADYVGHLNAVLQNERFTCSFNLIYNEEKGVMDSELITDDLCSLVEIQFRMSIATRISHRKCVSCTKWMSIHPGTGRPDKQYCSDACRMRAYRKRKTATSS